MYSGPYIKKDGLILFLDAGSINSYPGSGNTWSSLINNYSVNLVNAPTVTNGYISFDGTNEYGSFETEFPFVTGNGTDFTFEVWFKMRTLPTVEYGANGHIWGGENGNDLVLYLNPASGGVSRGVMVYDDTRYSTAMMTSAGFLANTWYQWVVTGNGTTNTVTHYINGELDRGPTGVSPTSQYVRAWGGTRFAYDARYGTYSSLDLAIVKQYTREVTPQEVEQNFRAYKNRFDLS